MSHNKKLDVLLEEVNGIVDAAKKEEDFRPAFAKLREFKNTTGPIKYDHSAKWWVFAVSLVLGGIFAYFFFTSLELQDALEIWGLAVIGAFAFAAAIPLIMIVTSNDKISGLSDWIFKKDVFFDNGLKVIGVEKGLYEKFRGSFGEFRNRGDESRYIESMVEGRYKGKEAEFGFRHYVFHYVEVYYVPVVKQVGKSTIVVMERRTRTCYRYGLMSEFGYAKRVAVVSGGGSYDYPAKWNTASKNFNDTFSVYADDEMAAVKFLSPSVILAFEELARHFSGLNLEISRKGELNIAFSDDDALDTARSRQYSIAQPEEFEREIESFLGLPKLNKLLAFLEILHKYNDKNF